ncbi:hypothetical protein JHK85_001782 [Glycine max]|uniref:RRM domain-containing protein n=2 Tax=Glycine subgen. Soja TaxID=1462606 RepID=K7K3R9_SOYBN|nr:hypothetical protein JHK85_001782 [Glycine max]KAG5089123.1 hypothetical protein JHK86_001735 [Glycine max]KAH1163024.1 hypothetical protein GYH30_001523 [Glycine max]RZC29896.1 hypothetical protein D0Y65_001489 [Glycine soja]
MSALFRKTQNNISYNTYMERVNIPPIEGNVREITRFPEDVTEKDLWVQFKRWGDVREVFISKKRNKGGRRYGFVRFSGVTDVHRLERQLDNLIVGGLKLYVNVPKYERGKGRDAVRRPEPKTQTEGDHQGKTTPYQNHSRYREPQMSYAKALLTNPTTSTPRRYTENASPRSEGSQSSVHLEIPTGTKQWYVEAWMGRIKKLANLETAEDDIAWELGTDVVPKYLGDDLFLLLGLSDNRAEEVVEEEARHGTTPFHTLEKWNPKLRAGHRLTSVLCWGIPLNAWETANIRKIVAPIGEFMEVDDDADEMRRLDRARVLIRTSWKPILQHTVNLHIAGELHKVHIVEETGLINGRCSCKLRSICGSSDAIASDDSVIASPRSDAIEVLDSTLTPRDIDGNTTARGTNTDNRENPLLPSGTPHDDDPADKTPARWTICKNSKADRPIPREGNEKPTGRLLTSKMETTFANEETPSTHFKPRDESNGDQNAARSSRDTEIVDPMHGQGTQNEWGVGNLQMASSKATRVPLAADRGQTIDYKETMPTLVTESKKEACDISDAICGPLLVGLNNPILVEPDTQQNINSAANKPETLGTRKVYLRNKGCRKQKALISVNVCQTDESPETNNLKQTTVDIATNSLSNKGAESPSNKAMKSTACQF